MVYAGELRKGNLVKCRVHLPIGFKSPVLVHAEVIEIRDDWVETSEGFHKYKNIDPITLTEEILLNSGGEKIDEKILFNKDDKLNIQLIINDDNFFLTDSEGNILSCPINSIHHFQNLYFFLKGNEIKIDLSK